MAFARRRVEVPRRGPAVHLWALISRILAAVARIVLSAAGIILLAGVMLVLRMMQGPIELPALGQMAAERVNAESRGIHVDVGALTLRLSDGRAPSGLQFQDVRISSESGEPLFAVPRVAASFRLGDLISGRIRPVRLSVIGADAQFIRTSDGRVRFGLGRTEGISLERSDTAVTTAAGQEAIDRLIDSLSGNREPIPELSSLRLIEVVGTTVIFDDRRLGGGWSSHGADLQIERTSSGARAVLEIDDIERGALGAAVRVVADRRSGSDQTVLRASFGRLDTRELAQKLPGLGWMEAFGTTLEGAISATLDDHGKVHALNGEVIAEHGVVRTEPEIRFDVAAVEFRMDPSTGHVYVAPARLSAPGIEAMFDAVVATVPAEGDDPLGLQAQLGISQLQIEQPDVFVEPLHFDAGQLALRWQPETDRIDIKDSWLGSDQLIIGVDATIRRKADGLGVAMRARVPNMDVAQLIRHWPYDAASNARAWIAENITEADIHDLVAQAEFGQGMPKLSMDFGFSELRAAYLADMSPIEKARGEAHVSYTDLYLTVDEAFVSPQRGQRIDLDGSRVVINDFWSDAPPAIISVLARGPTAAVLNLIDQDPLRLVRKLDLDLGRIDGSAEVAARLRFPLIKALTINDVEAAADANLMALSISPPLRGDRTIAIRSELLEVSASVEELRLSGRISAADTTAQLDWREIYSGARGLRTVTLAGQMTKNLLTELGFDSAPVDGVAPYELTLRQVAKDPVEFALAADLERAELQISALDWSKPAGAPGRLEAEGSVGDRLKLDKFLLETEDLRTAGSIEVGEHGDLIGARFERLQMSGFADTSVEINRGADNIREVRLVGGVLDMSERLEHAGSAQGAAGEPLRLHLELERIKISEKISVRGATGRLDRNAQGDVTGQIKGTVGPYPDAAITIGLDLPGSGPGRATLESPNAGAALRAAGLYSDASGGTLFLTATIGTEGGPDVSGEVRIDDVLVRSEATFRDVLRDGGLSDAQAEVSNGGIRFRQILVPFSYEDGVVTLDDAIAVSPFLGLKLSGTLNERSENLDMVGVLSPAYGLTGVLNNIPLVGEVLSGGRGEGILAVTFTLKGAISNPEFLVNPLSLLTPGVLRKVFTARGDGADETTAPPAGSDR